jgi:hypothetical protein
VVEEQLLKLEGKILRDAPFKKRRSGGWRAATETSRRNLARRSL